MIGEWDPDAAPARWASWSHAVSEMFDVALQVRDVGPESESSRQLWIARVADFDDLAADMRSDALADGADPGLVEDACLFGIQVGIDPGPPDWRPRPARQHPTEVFFVDLLHLDLWHLERTAALQLAYEKRVRCRSGDARADLDREQALSDRTDLRRRRVSGVVAGARITAQEGEELWGTGAEWMRRMHAGAVNRMSEAELVEMWTAYADVRTPLLWPPYLLTDPDTGKPLRPNLTEPPRRRRCSRRQQRRRRPLRQPRNQRRRPGRVLAVARTPSNPAPIPRSTPRCRPPIPAPTVIPNARSASTESPSPNSSQNCLGPIPYAIWVSIIEAVMSSWQWDGHDEAARLSRLAEAGGEWLEAPTSPLPDHHQGPAAGRDPGEW